MKPLIKPKDSSLNEDDKFKALDECNCYQACNSKRYADDDKDDILF
ncbi:MAG: hypothetical protein HXX16_02575 [Bacteroidales bacterium]|nr:hypothetical protein [Bacteroidales bacterium]